MRDHVLLVLLLLVPFIFCDLSTKFVSPGEYPNNATLLGGNYMLHWNANEANNTIEIAIVVNGVGWAALGINPSPLSGMQEADITMGYIDSGGNAVIFDRWSSVQGVPPQLDSQQTPPGSDTNNIIARQGGLSNGQVTLKFMRYLNVSRITPVDPWDKSITNGTNRISFAFNPTSTSLTAWHGANSRGVAEIQFIGGGAAPPLPTPTRPPIEFHLIITGIIIFIIVLLGLLVTWFPWKRNLFFDFLFYRKVGPMSNNFFLRHLQYNAIANLTLGELFMLFCYFCCFGAWFAYGYVSGQAKGLVSPVGRGFAWVNILNLSLILLPVTRYSIWLYIFGISFDRAIKFHRWLARWTFLIISVHGLVMIGYYASLNNAAYVFKFDSAAPHYTLAGTIAWACIALAFLLTLEPIRRRFWEIFQYSHVPLGVIALVFAIVHATVLFSLPYFAFGILLYGIDLLLRFGFGICQPAKLVSAEYIESAGVTKLTIRKKWPFKFTPGEFVFIWIDKVSIFEWHPFSISDGHNAESVSGETEFTLHVKNMAKGGDLPGGKTIIKRWTERLAIFAQKDNKNAHIRVEGPYGHSLWDAYDRYETVVMFAGGIGITPINCMFRSLVDRYQNEEKQTYRTESSPRRRVYLIWTIRTREMLDAFPDLVDGECIKDPQIATVKVYVTREDQHNGPVLFSGRPNITKLLNEICDQRKKELNRKDLYLTVHTCGVPQMDRDVQAAAWHCNNLHTRVHFQSLSFAI